MKTVSQYCNWTRSYFLKNEDKGREQAGCCFKNKCHAVSNPLGPILFAFFHNTSQEYNSKIVTEHSTPKVSGVFFFFFLVSTCQSIYYFPNQHTTNTFEHCLKVNSKHKELDRCICKNTAPKEDRNKSPKHTSLHLHRFHRCSRHFIILSIKKKTVPSPRVGCGVNKKPYVIPAASWGI